MTKFLKVALFFLISTVSIQLSAQHNVVLNEKFKKYDIVKLDVRNVYQELQSKRYNGSLTLSLNEQYTWDLVLKNSGLISENYVLNVATEEGIKTTYGTNALAMSGYVLNHSDSQVSLTFNDDFIYGFISTGATMLFIEPLRHYQSSASANEFIVYNTKDVLSSRNLQCGYDQYKHEMDKHRTDSDNHRHDHGSTRANECKEVEINLAADYSMVQKYGSVSAVENHNLGVLNNVKTNYDSGFADELQLKLNEQWISSCSSCDPWSSNTDSGVLLNSFTSWGPGGFSTSHDVASLWSNRNFNGSTIGLAWVGTVCSNYKYNVLQDFSSDADLKRCLQAHEIGHNFDADHSNTGIMQPSVSYDNFWDPLSKTQIENFYSGLNCLSTCTPNNPPVADFTYLVIEQCTPVQIQFTNTSTFATSYSWTFEGGYPATSTQKDPLILYYASGTFNVTLTASNGSLSNTKTISITVIGKEVPVPLFSYTVNGYEVLFQDESIGATNWEWDFGDGSPNSFVQNPVHTYANNGYYQVTLQVSNECGTNSTWETIEILVPPSADFDSNITNGCNPLTVNFLNQSKDAESFFWSFPGGTPSTSTDENPVVVYNDAGAYDVTLEVSNFAGTHSKTVNNFIVVDQSPIAGFSYSTSGNTITFIDNSSYGTSYSWDFGDGETSIDQNPIHIYKDNGVYTVIQSVTNGCSTKTQTSTITIAIAPIPSFTSDYSGPICVEETVQFTSTSTYGPTSFVWEFEGGIPSTSTDENPIVQYNNSGSFKVTLSVTNDYGTNQIEFNNYIVVEPKPVVAFTERADGLKVDFTQNIIGATNHSWDFGDGSTSTDTNPSHTYAGEGTYTVMLSAENDCGVTEFTKIINVVLLPTADFDAVDNVVCPGETVQFENLSSPSATSWTWEFEGGIPATSNEENPTVVYSASGEFNVSLTVTNASGQATVTKTAFISVLAPVTASFVGEAINNQIELINTDINSSSSSWEIFNDEFSTTETGEYVVVTVPSNGIYNVILTNSNKCGTAVSDTISINITGYPEASFTANGGGILCENQEVNFVANGGNSFVWEFEGGTPATSEEQIVNVTYNATGTYLVVLIATNSYGTDTLRSFVTINTKPHADFEYNINAENVKFLLTGSGQAYQNWEFGDGFSSTELSPEHTYTSSGQYTVTLVTGNGCGSDTITKNLAITVGVSDLHAVYGINIYPNPAKDFINVQIEKQLSSECTLQLVSTTGQSILEQTMFIGEKQNVSLDITDVPNGMYILNLKTDNVIIPNKITIFR